MNLREADNVMRKIEGSWMMKSPDGARGEWLDFLLKLDYRPALAAVESLRETSRYRPAMSELRECYLRLAQSIAAHDVEPVKQLPGESGESDPRKRYTLLDVYGHSQQRWVYCWRCCMAIALEEQATTAVYTPDVGLAHRFCPKPGTAPMMSVAERSERESYWLRNGVTVPA